MDNTKRSIEVPSEKVETSVKDSFKPMGKNELKKLIVFSELMKPKFDE